MMATAEDSVPFYAVNGADLSIFEPLPCREYTGHTVGGPLLTC